MNEFVNCTNNWLVYCGVYATIQNVLRFNYLKIFSTSKCEREIESGKSKISKLLPKKFLPCNSFNTKTSEIKTTFKLFTGNATG